MIFNGIDFSGILRCNPARRVMAPVVVESTQIPGKDGEIVGEVTLGPQVITVTAEVIEHIEDYRKFAEVRRNLAGNLYVKDEACDLILDDDPDIRYKAYLTDAPELSGWWYGARVTLTFTAYDPAGYGIHRTKQLNKGTNEVHIEGTHETRCRATIDCAAGDAARLFDDVTGKYVQTDAADAARTVIIDCVQEYTVSGGSYIDVVLSSRYFDLTPGVHNIDVSGDAVMEWDERWI